MKHYFIQILNNKITTKVTLQGIEPKTTSTRSFQTVPTRTIEVLINKHFFIRVTEGTS